MAGAVATWAQRFDGWIDGPAALVAEMARAGRPGRAVSLALTGDGGTVSVRGGQAKAASLTLPLHADAADSKARIAALVEGRSVTITVPAAWTIERRLELPLEAASHVDGIVASRLSALSPIPPAEVLFGHHVAEVDRTARKLRLEVSILPRARIAGLLDWVAVGKAREVEIVASGAGGKPVVLMPRRLGSVGRNRAARVLLTGIVALSAVAILGALAVRPVLAPGLTAERARLELRADVARRKISDATLPANGATLPEQAALAMKNEAVSALGALDDLAAALPLHAHASEILLSDGLLRVSGRTTDLPDVLTSLESSGRFVQTRQVGAATREDDGPLSDFVVETRPLIRTGGALK
ncbi:MAG TPA: hypothetical protein VNS02_11920 [Rhizobiaceae bacterium]|nr:hypothetical protein [Rhizobiaceae bacterium]